MVLKDILNQIVENQDNLLLNDGYQDWSAKALLENLSERRLKTNAHMQAGLYIAEISSAGYLGSVLYKIKQPA